MAVLSYPGVYVQEVSSGVRPIEAAGTSTAAFFGVAEKGPVGEVRKIFNFTEFQNVYGNFLSNFYLAHSVFQFFNNGGRQCYVGRIAINANAASVTILDRAETPEDSLTILASSPGTWGNHLNIVIDDNNVQDQNIHFNIAVYRSDPSIDEEPVELERFEDLSMDVLSDDFVGSIVNTRSNYIRVEVNEENSHTISEKRPQDTSEGQFYLVGDAEISGAVSAVSAGDDGDTVQVADYTSAFTLLDTIRDVSILAVPGVGSADDAAAIADAGMNYCKNRPLSDCFYIADVSKTDVTLSDAKAFRDSINTPNSFGAIYFPWLKMIDPAGRSSEPIIVPPSGYVAGIYSRIDASRGVWKAPAGTEARVAGSVGLVTDLTDEQQGDLNKHKKSISVIRQYPGSGIVLWGARTVSSDPEYKYIPVRRMANFLRVSIFNGIQWAVFEPNDDGLWAELRLNIRSFMMTLFRQGAFQGSTPTEAFFVKVDSETTAQADIDLGIVNIVIGFAPLKPAEFVVVKISQKAGQL